VEPVEVSNNLIFGIPDPGLHSQYPKLARNLGQTMFPVVNFWFGLVDILLLKISAVTRWRLSNSTSIREEIRRKWVRCVPLFKVIQDRRL